MFDFIANQFTNAAVSAVSKSGNENLPADKF